MPKLIDTEMQLVDLLDAIMVEQEAGREVPDEALTLVHEYTLEAADKRDACAAFVAFVERAEGDCDSEIKRLTARKRSIALARERFMNYVQSIMETQGVKALMGSQFKFILRESESVDPGPTELLPEEFIRTKVITEPDKIALMEALKRGEAPGEARLVTRNSLKIAPLAVKDHAGSTLPL